MPEQISYPYGNAFLIGTNAIDRMAATIATDQRQRELLRQRQQQQLDDEFAKNVAGIRDADVGDLTKLYGEWKLANQQAMKKREGVSPEEQLQILRKKGEVYKKIAESKAGLREEEDWRSDMQRNPDSYDDNAYTYLGTRRKLPLSQLETYKDATGAIRNLRDFNTYRYKGSDTDFSKIDTAAAGTPKQVFQKEEALDGGLQFKITPYMYGNTPLQYYENQLSAAGDRKVARSAAAIIAQADPQVISAINNKYKNIPKERWEQMGVSDPQQIEISPNDAPVIKWAKHKAQLYALNNEPKQGTPVFRDNKAAIDARNFVQQKELEGLRQKNRKELVDYRQQAKDMDEKTNEVWIDNYIDKLEDEANTPGSQKSQYRSGGKTIIENIIPIDPVLAKALTKGTGANAIAPEELTITADGKYRPIYFKYENGERKKGKDGTFIVNEDLSVPITRDQFKLSLGAKSVTPSQRTKEMRNNPAAKPSKSYTYEGITGTYEQLVEVLGKDEADKLIKSGKAKPK